MSHSKSKEPQDWESATPVEAEAVESKTNQYEEAQEKKWPKKKKDSHPWSVSTINRKQLYTFSALRQPSQEPLDRLEIVSQ